MLDKQTVSEYKFSSIWLRDEQSNDANPFAWLVWMCVCVCARVRARLRASVWVRLRGGTKYQRLYFVS